VTKRIHFIGICGTGMATLAAIGIAAGIAPAWRAAQADIVSALRHIG
jgi:hypothetical protein